MYFVDNLTLLPLYPGKEPRYSLYRRLGEPQGRSKRVWRRDNLFPSIRIRTPNCPVCNESPTDYDTPGITYTVT
jgi:hypothetical protein